ncbi:hypothetical protein [Pseudomonas fluvialis]|uniref:hypothetical protein n=1 Tax=Pseudomonas fluvialis TaxID=1793966 RepID=UPI0012FE8D05|nr:hypothetical protein [Pseudomonas pharmacofabricae]
MTRRRQVVWRAAAGLLCLLAGVLVGLACLLLLSGLCLWGLGWLGEQWGLDTANGYYLMYLAVPLGLGLLALCVALLAAALGSGLGTGRWLWRRLSRLLPLA